MQYDSNYMKYQKQTRVFIKAIYTSLKKKKKDHKQVSSWHKT